MGLKVFLLGSSELHVKVRHCLKINDSWMLVLCPSHKTVASGRAAKLKNHRTKCTFWEIWLEDRQCCVL